MQRMNETTAFALLFAVVVGGVAGASDDGVDSVNWHDRNGWICARKLALLAPEFTGEFKGAKKRSREDYAHDYVAALSAGLRGAFGTIAVVEQGKPVPADSDFVIATDVTALTTGSRAARFWVGFGAGHSSVDLTLTGSARPEQQESFRIAHSRASAFGLAKDEAAENLAEAVKDIVGVLITGKAGACLPATSQPAAAKRNADGRAPLTFESEPSGAEVYLDTKLIGTAPVVGYPVSEGSHTIEFRLVGYSPWKREVEVAATAATTFHATLVREP